LLRAGLRIRSFFRQIRIQQIENFKNRIRFLLTLTKIFFLINQISSPENVYKFYIKNFLVHTTLHSQSTSRKLIRWKYSRSGSDPIVPDPEQGQSNELFHDIKRFLWGTYVLLNINNFCPHLSSILYNSCHSLMILELFSMRFFRFFVWTDTCKDFYTGFSFGVTFWIFFKVKIYNVRSWKINYLHQLLCYCILQMYLKLDTQ